MSLTKSLLAVATLSLLSGCVVVASPSYADYHVQRQLTLDATSLVNFELETGAGSVNIIGKSDIVEIEVTADIFTDAKYKDNFELTLTKSGDVAYLIAKTKSSSGFWIGNSPHIDVVIAVPEGMAIAINDGSGDITIKHIKNNVNITDGSGDLNISDVVGNVDIVDGSGDLVLTNIRGDLAIEDGSGDLTVHQVEGVVTIDDGSGDIDIQDVGGLKIIETGSGGLRVNNVKGGFEIGS